MWSRKELKQQAREALQRNYWRIVLVTLLLALLGNTNLLGSSPSSAAGAASTGVVDGTASENRVEIVEDITEDDEEDITENSAGENSEDNSEDYSGSIETADIEMVDIAHEDSSAVNIGMLAMSKLITISDRAMDDMGRTEVIITGVVVIITCFAIVMVILAFAIAVMALLFNPIIVGAQRFMLRSVDGRAEVKEVAYAFDHSYKNVVKVMFRTQLSVFLWSLLFVIPGFYKQYQYRMVEYIMAEHPDMYYKDAMQLSKDMMNGEKWNAFVLDLSFILWKAVSLLTCGIAHILFVGPYQHLTNAALYRTICARREGMDRRVVQSIDRKDGQEYGKRSSEEYSRESGKSIDRKDGQEYGKGSSEEYSRESDIEL